MRPSSGSLTSIHPFNDIIIKFPWWPNRAYADVTSYRCHSLVVFMIDTVSIAEHVFYGTNNQLIMDKLNLEYFVLENYLTIGVLLFLMCGTLIFCIEPESLEDWESFSTYSSLKLVWCKFRVSQLPGILQQFQTCLQNSIAQEIHAGWLSPQQFQCELLGRELGQARRYNSAVIRACWRTHPAVSSSSWSNSCSSSLFLTAQMRWTWVGRT